MNRKSMIVVGVFTVMSVASFAVPPELVGTYTGVMEQKELNHEIGKLERRDPFSIELKIEANRDISVRFLQNNFSRVGNFSVINNKYFTYRHISDSSIWLIKGKFTGKGRKIKGVHYWSNSGTWHEGTFKGQRAF